MAAGDPLRSSAARYFVTVPLSQLDAPRNSGDAETVSSLGELARILGHEFARPQLLREALTHASAAGRDAPGYERLEFLGDRVLALVVADLLLAQFPREREGALARRHAQLVRRETLVEIARAIGLGRFLILTRGEDDAGAREHDGVLADVLEAAIGALYLDGGISAARAFLESQWRSRLDADPTPPQDGKTALQEWAQGRGKPLPDYREVARSGPPHAPVFSVEVSVHGETPEVGEGRSKRMAEQAAAERLLSRLVQLDRNDRD
ncbi:MAG: ribonuclease III [Alphaproteobacteria bacterium]|nr:ribonuclease III [Alphaproteobacteria bacterium]